MSALFFFSIVRLARSVVLLHMSELDVVRSCERKEKFILCNSAQCTPHEYKYVCLNRCRWIVRRRLACLAGRSVNAVATNTITFVIIYFRTTRCENVHEMNNITAYTRTAHTHHTNMYPTNRNICARGSSSDEHVNLSDLSKRNSCPLGRRHLTSNASCVDMCHCHRHRRHLHRHRHRRERDMNSDSLANSSMANQSPSAHLISHSNAYHIIHHSPRRRYIQLYTYLHVALVPTTHSKYINFPFVFIFIYFFVGLVAQHLMALVISRIANTLLHT